MSNNIHGFGSENNNDGYRRVPSNDNEGNRGGAGGAGGVGGMMGFGQGDNVISTNPREESFFSFFKNVCCPSFKLLSVVFILSCVDIIIYIATLCFGIKRNPIELLAPTYETLDMFGMKIPLKIQQGQVWRLITFGVLHANFVHVTVNVISQLIIGSIIEAAIGSLAAGFLYLLSNIGGGIFSCVVNSASGVGASVAIFGVLGAYFGFMIMNWKYLDRVMGSCNKFCNLIFMIMIVIMNISYGFSNPIIDNYGHIGGLIFGFFLVFVLSKPKEEGDGLCCSSKIWFYLSLVILILLYVILTACLFGVKKYS